MLRVGRIVWAVLALPLTACIGLDGGNGETGDLNSRIQGAITLEQFGSCPEAETYLKTMAVEQIDLQVAGIKSGKCWGWSCAMRGGKDWGAPVNAGGATGGAAGGEAPSGSGAADYSKTNTQEEGVDEADLVKTDGEWLYVLRGTNLLIVRATPADQAQIVSTTPLPGTPVELFLEGDTVLVFSTMWAWQADGAQTGPKAWNDQLAIIVVDASDHAAPVILRTSVVEGSYVSSRLVDGTAHIVVRTQVTLPWADVSGLSGGGSVTPTDPDGGPVSPADASGPNTGGGTTPSEGTDPANTPDPGKADVADPDPPIEVGSEEWLAKVDAARDAAVAAVNALTLDDLLPLTWTLDADGTKGTPERLTACTDLYHPSVAHGPGILSIVSIPLADAPQTSAAIVGNGDTVYASTQTLYVASDIYNGWYAWYPEKQEDWQITVIHAFDMGSKVTYTASGKVPGHVLNQFSMGEHDGRLRVATTKDVWTGTDESESAVTVLRREGSALVEEGRVGGLGKGERIYSARFIGDKGYVVTFRQVDPLYTLDLSDPAAPKVMGELKIPGFSTYIHPYGDDHLLTVGRDTLDNGEWVQLAGVQLTIFDVTDLAAPTQAHKTVLGDAGTTSDALYDHKAFTFFAPKGLLAIPLSSWGSGPSGGGGVVPGGGTGVELDPLTEPFAGAVVYDVSPETGFSKRGTIDHSSFLAGTDGWRPEHVSRTVIIGEHIYTIGDLGMKVCALEGLAPVASVDFPQSAGGDTPKPEPAM
ncbi:MAG: hypothetical protein AMXMBFR64_46290 [Myxococcales bacterium]